MAVLATLLVGCWGGSDVDPSGAQLSPDGTRPGGGTTTVGQPAPDNGGDSFGGGTYDLPTGGSPTGGTTRLDGVGTNPNGTFPLGPSMGDMDGDMQVITDRRWVPVYFAYNQSVIGEAERDKLSELANYLTTNPRFHVLIEGHCDERGSEEYNRGLGERRALSVKDYLVNLGVEPNRLRTLSYGEERPADPGNTESAYALNRRAEFVILLPKE